MEDQGTAEARATQGATLQELTRGVKKFEEGVAGVPDALSDINDRAVNFISEKPLAAIGIAFGVGYLVGKLASRRWLM